jgi:hypothetical protein
MQFGLVSGGGVSGGGSGSSRIPPNEDTFQVADCAGIPIGDPISVTKTIVVNKLITKICNVTEIANAIKGVNYNEPYCIILYPGDFLLMDIDIYHTIKYKVIGGDGTLSINNEPNINLFDMDSEKWEASTTFNKTFLFTAGTGIIKISATK